MGPGDGLYRHFGYCFGPVEGAGGHGFMGSLSGGTGGMSPRVIPYVYLDTL